MNRRTRHVAASVVALTLAALVLAVASRPAHADGSAGPVRFRLKQPWPDFMTFYGTPATGAGWIVPKKYVEKVGEEGFKKHPIGAGPYRYVSINPGIELVLEAVDGYWRRPPTVKQAVFKAIPDATT